MTNSENSFRKPRIRKSRGRGLRTTNGCITCRKRHLKCDETRPICGQCERNEKQCGYASTRRNVDVPTSNSEVADTDTPASAVQQTDSPTIIGNEEVPGLVATPSILNDLHDTIDLGWTVPEASTTVLTPSLLDHLPGNDIGSTPSPGTVPQNYLSPSNVSFAAARWFGLLANDAARDSTQLSTIPNFWNNQSLSLGQPGDDTLGQVSSLQHATQVLDSPPASIISHTSTDPGFVGTRNRSEEQIWQSARSIELLPVEQTLFEHFIHQVSPWIDLFDPTNQFSTLVAHLAIHNAGLMNAILALSFRHLALNPRLDDQDIPNKEEAALQYYYQTLHYVQRAMQYSSYNTSLELLATTLIISAYEMLDNSTNDWGRHLEGVFLIQRSQTLHGESGGLHSSVWWAWLCQDIWAAFREKRKTLTFWVPQKPLSALLPHELATRSIYITAKVMSYCADSAKEDDIQRRVDGAARLHTMLDDWRRHLTLEFSPLPAGTRHHSTYFRPIWIRPPSFAVAVQFSSVSYILLLANEPSLGGLEQYLERQNVIKRCIEDICEIAITLQDAASSLMSSQALFIAGMFTQDNKTREAILELLETCRDRAGWPVKSLGIELQQLWGDHSSAETTAATS